jgi:hypothetical protein
VSYSTSEYVVDSERQLAFAKEINAKYPDAHHDDKRWWSMALPLAECDVALCDERKGFHGSLVTTVRFGKRLEHGIVWLERPELVLGLVEAGELLEALKRKAAR